MNAHHLNELLAQTASKGPRSSANGRCPPISRRVLLSLTEPLAGPYDALRSHYAQAGFSGQAVLRVALARGFRSLLEDAGL